LKLLILALNLLIKLIIFFLNLLFSFDLELLDSLNSEIGFRMVNLNSTFNLSTLFIFMDLSWQTKETIIFCRHKILFIFIKECKIMLFTLFISLCFYIQIRYINPISHSAFHNSLNQEKLFLCIPIRMKHIEL
jgi:hypothetical protein